MKGYIGTYASTSENGIYVFHFDEHTKSFRDCQIIQADTNTKYLSLYKGILAYPFTSPSAAVKMIKDGKAYTAGNEQSVSCFIVQDENYMYTANYHEGSVHQYLKDEAGLQEVNAIFIQRKAGAHQVLLYQERLFVPCLLLDCIHVYDRNTLAPQGVINFPKGCGPRHGVIDEEHACLYVVSEYECVVFCVQLQPPYSILKVLSLLTDDNQGEGAAIRIGQDHRFLYVSVRLCNQIFVIDIKAWKVIQVMDSGGDHPRDIAIDPSGQFLFVTNRFSNHVVVFEIDEKMGTLNKITVLEHIIEGVSIVFEEGEEYET